MFNLSDLKPLFSLLRERFEKNRDYLNALDASVGDGDHGFTMLRAFQAAERAVQSQIPDLGIGFDAVAEAMAEQTGGAIGPLLAALFAEGGVVFKDKTSAGASDWAEFFQGGLLAVQQVGEAKVGDKTMVDALSPAASAIKEMTSDSLQEALQAGAKAARLGAESTKDLVASFGRASFVAERSRGHQDAGATSIALIIQGIADYVSGKRAEAATFLNASEPFTPPTGKLINHPDDMVAEDNEGLALAYPNLVLLSECGILLRACQKTEGKTALVIGHGGGHTPSMGGFVGPGLLDADVYGPIFTCASGLRIAEAVQMADRGGGVVLLVSNHSGDVLNARLAVRRAQTLGHQVIPVLLGDDIATAPREDFRKRRGLGGLLFALKTGGAAAEKGLLLSEVAGLMEKTNERTATLAVALRPPTHPATGTPLFDLPTDEIEIGTGVHGEVGIYRGQHLPADKIVDLLLERLIADLAPFDPKRMLLFVNGSGGTSLMELNILYRRAHQALEAQSFKVSAGVVGSYFTTFEMAGFSLSLCALDEELESFWHQPASGPHFRWPLA